MNNNSKAELFHDGELYFQQKLAVDKHIAFLAPKLISDRLTAQHQAFFSQLSMLFVASVDETGQVWASVIGGGPGFINSTNEKYVQIRANFIPADPIRQNLITGRHLGFLGLQFETRRRNRFAARITKSNQDLLQLEVDTAFGNCPKYIQSRNIKYFEINQKSKLKNSVERISSIDNSLKKLITKADTFFIASYYQGDIAAAPKNNSSKKISSENINSKNINYSADISHRGGRAGFVRVESHNVLCFDDYPGNNVFMTLGNLKQNPVAGLLFIDFDSGDVVQLACTSDIVERDDCKNPRQIRLNVKYGWRYKSALTISSNFMDYSPLLK